MPDNSVGLLFWALAIVNIVAAIAVVTLKKVDQSLIGCVISILTTGAVLVLLDYSLFVIFYLLAAGGVIVTFAAVVKIKTGETNESVEFAHHPRTFVNLIVSTLIFTGSLYLISHTDIWQYDLAPAALSVTELIKSFFLNYLLLIVIVVTFLAAISLLLFTDHKRRNT